MTGERILVTGGSGFIGRTLVPVLLAAGAEVTVADLVAYPDPAVPSVVGDLTDPAVRDAAVTGSLTGIIHLAARTSVLGSLADPAGTHRLNVEATAGLLELARQRSVRKFLMASTNAVTGDVGTATIHEGLPLLPLTPYGATKAAGEMLLSGYAGGFGMVTCAVRLTNVYGPHMALKDSLVPRIMRTVTGGGVLQIYGTGEQRRDLLHVGDAAAGILRAWNTDHIGPLIVGSGRSVSVLDLIAAAHEVIGAPIPVEHIDAKPGEMPAVVVSVARARELGYEPSIPLRGGLATVWEEFRA